MSNQPYLSRGHVKVDFLIATVLCHRRWYSPTRHMGLVFSFVHWIWKKKYRSRVGHKHSPNRHWSFLTAITPKHRGGQGPASCKSSNNNWKGGSYKSSVRIKFPRASTTQTTEKETDGIGGMPYTYTCHTHRKAWQQNNVTVAFVKEAGVGSDPAEKCILTNSYREVWCQQSLH